MAALRVPRATKVVGNPMYDPAGMLVALASLGATKQQARRRIGRTVLFVLDLLRSSYDEQKSWIAILFLSLIVIIYYCSPHYQLLPVLSGMLLLLSMGWDVLPGSNGSFWDHGSVAF